MCCMLSMLMGGENERGPMEEMMAAAKKSSRMETSTNRWRLYANPHFSMSELDRALAQIKELRAELETERKLRGKAEALASELAKKQRDREEEVGRMATEMEEERRMLRISEVWREERVQMKLNEARLVMEEKLHEFSNPNKMAMISPASKHGSLCSSETNSNSSKRSHSQNPHIRRGIKGFVEFPRTTGMVQSNMVSSSSTSRAAAAAAGKNSLRTINLECPRSLMRVITSHYRRNLAPGGGGGGGLSRMTHNMVM